MKPLLVLIAGLLAVGCTTVKDIGVHLGIGRPNNTTVKPVKELTPEEQKLRDMVVGEYGINKVGYTGKSVFLDNGVHEYYVNGKKQGEHKWTIVNEEIVVKYPSGSGAVFRVDVEVRLGIPRVRSITKIEYIDNGKRTDWPKEKQGTWEKIN